MKLPPFIFICVLILSCDSDDYPFSDIPSVVLNGFWTVYPEATEVGFSKTGRNYEVKFEVDGKDLEALITSTGTVLKEKKEISWHQLPPGVQEFLIGEFGEEDIEDLERVSMEGEVYYQAQVQGFLRDRKVVMDTMGRRGPSLPFWK